MSNKNDKSPITTPLGFTPPPDDSPMIRLRQNQREILFDDEAMQEQPARFNALLQMLRLPINGRNSKDKQIICQLLLDYKFFVDLGTKDPKLVMTIARYSQIINFKQNDIIANQDEVQEKPLFLLSGDVLMVRGIKDPHEQSLITQQEKDRKKALRQNRGEVQDMIKNFKEQTQFEQKLPQGLTKRLSKLTTNVNSNEQRMVGIVKPGKWLFQLSLNLKIPIHATFAANQIEQVYCLTMPNEVYNQCIGNQYRQDIQEGMRYLIQCNFGNFLPQNSLLLLASKLKVIRLKSNTIVSKQGEECKHVYFIKSGRIKIVRDIAFFPLYKYENAKNNQIYKDDPLKAKERSGSSQKKECDSRSSIGSANMSGISPYHNESGYRIPVKPEIHSIQLNQLVTFQSFGMPYSIMDEDAIDLVHGEMLREDFPFTSPLNYSAVSIMPSEVYKIQKKYFQNLVKERALHIYKANLVTFVPDWVYRKCYINNNIWEVYKKNMVQNKIEEMKIFNGKKNKYLYGAENFVLGSSRSLQTIEEKKKQAEYQDYKVNVDLSYLKQDQPYGFSQQYMRKPGGSRSTSVKPIVKNNNRLNITDIPEISRNERSFQREEALIIENIRLKNTYNLFSDKKDLRQQRKNEIKFALCENNKIEEALSNLKKVYVKLVE